MIATSECACGNPLKEDGTRCETCSALQVLDLAPGATRKEIESTYRVLVKVWHPDRFQTDPKLKEAAEEKLKAINAAHAYLLSVPDGKPRRRAKPKPQPGPTERSANKTYESGVAATTRGSRSRHRSSVDAAVVSTILIRGTILICGIGFVAFLLLGLDSYLSSNPTTGRFYSNYRGQVESAVKSQTARLWDSVEQSTQRNSAAPATPTPATAVQPDGASVAAALPPPPKIPMPYVTTGLTKDEVMGVMGTPTSLTVDTLAYKGSVFYFKNGVVTGWKVDRALIPFRVKLWPQGHVDAHLTTFAVGSSKNEVVAVQGTPNLLSRDKFAYGSSQVFFEDDHVIGWMNDHNSIQLRTAAH